MSRRGLTPLRILSRWRGYVEVVARAVRRVEPRARVYLAGGAAEGRLTVASDIDVVVYLPWEPGFEEAAMLRARILEEAEGLGLPLYAPVELHIVGPRGLERFRGRLVEVSGRS